MAVQIGGTALLLHMDGTHGARVFTDSSPLQKTFSVYGETNTSAAQSKFGGTSAYFDGNGDWLYSPAHFDWDCLTKDFTIEFWVYFEDLTQTPHIVTLGYDISNRLTIFWYGGTCLIFTNVAGNGANHIASSQPSSTGIWEHWALVKSGITTTLYKNGTAVGSKDNMPLPSYRSDTTLGLGFLQWSSASKDYFKGYLDEVRIVNRVAVYTAPFTPPTAPLTVLSGVDLSTGLVSGKYVLGKGSTTFNPRPTFQPKNPDRRDRAPFGFPVTTFEAQGTTASLPWQFKGRGRIAGTVKEKASPTDKPVRRRVRLYREPDGLLVRTTWSDSVTGAYEFNGIPLDAKYTVVSHDYLTLYRAVLADNLAPELIP